MKVAIIKILSPFYYIIRKASEKVIVDTTASLIKSIIIFVFFGGIIAFFYGLVNVLNIPLTARAYIFVVIFLLGSFLTLSMIYWRQERLRQTMENKLEYDSIIWKYELGNSSLILYCPICGSGKIVEKDEEASSILTDIINSGRHEYTYVCTTDECPFELKKSMPLNEYKKKLEKEINEKDQKETKEKI